MRKLYEMENTVVRLETREECDEYLSMCEDVSWVWCDGDDPKPFYGFSEHICISIKNNFKYTNENFYRKINYTILTLKQLKERLGMWKEGDVIVDETGSERMILGICGKVIFISDCEHFDKSLWTNYTQKELEEDGWKLKQDNSDIIELTLKQIATLKGCDVEQLRIKD
jgi:hypothetical protein